MMFQKKISDCEIEIKKIGENTKVRVSQNCTKEQLEALNLKKFTEKEKNEAKSVS